MARWQVVTKESAKISGFPQLPIPANHMDLVRFGSAEETGYRRVLGELRRWLRQEIDGEKIPENHKLQPANLVFDIEVLETLGVVTSIQSLAVQGNKYKHLFLKYLNLMANCLRLHGISGISRDV